MKPLFAGSFDPFTKGHLSIARRALAMFGSLTIGIGVNERKKGEWTAEERLEAIRAIFAGDLRVEVAAYSGLTADFARANGNGILVRGARNTADFEAERNLADANRALAGLDTMILVTDPELAYVSSSLVRELLHHGHDISNLVAGKWNLKTTETSNG